MIGTRYGAHKANVIDLYETYKKKRGNLNDGINIKFLENQVNNLKHEKFLLAVAGEVKSGKSTFINALLGEELLPSDVLQSTNAVVEIFKSETSYLKVKFADKHEETLYDDPSTPDIVEAKEKLQEICQIHDNYRHIPTVLIDQFIIESNGQLGVDKNLVELLEQISGLRLDGMQSIIEQYIAERTTDKIPVQIEFGYPLKWSFNDLRIVDSPGVNAIGGVQDISFRFLEEANAILFVHPIKPIESESFMKFVGSVISNRSREMLFLVLTHAGLYSNDEVRRLHAEAWRLYQDIIPENRIIVVDSLLKLIHNDLANGVSVKEIRKSENKKKILASYREKAEDEGRELVDVVLEASRFEEMIKTIDEFSMKAPYLQLKEILEHIKKGYEEQEIQYSDKVNLLKEKKRNPQEFENEINRISKALEKYKLLKNRTVEDFKAKYTGRHSQWRKDINSMKVKYPELITGSKDIESTRKNFTDAINAVQEKMDEFSKKLTEKLLEKLEEIGKAFKEEYHISIPKVDLKALEEKAKKNAYKDEDIYEKRPVDFWDVITLGVARLFRNNKVKIGTKKVFDKEKYLDTYKTLCNKEFYKIVNSLPNKSKEVLENYLDLFSREVNSAIEERQKDLEEMEEKKQSNEEIIREIEELKVKKKEIRKEKLQCIEILEDLL